MRINFSLLINLNSLIKEITVKLIGIGVLEPVKINGIKINVIVRTDVIKIGRALKIKLNLRKGLLN